MSKDYTMRLIRNIAALIFALFVIALSCAGCADEGASASTPEFLASPPVPSPAQKEQEVLDALRQTDILEYLPEDTYAREADKNGMSP